MAYSIEALQDACYKNTTVLINKFNLRDAEELALVEATLVPAKAALWEESPRIHAFDFAHYKAIHAFLFEELYDWAGVTRTVDMSKKGTQFCPAAEIENRADAIFTRLKQQKLLANLKPKAFTNALVDFYGCTNELHPFREGNGRTQRVFISQLARNAGYAIDFSLIDTDLLMIATIQAANGTCDLLKNVFSQIIISK